MGRYPLRFGDLMKPSDLESMDFVINPENEWLFTKSRSWPNYLPLIDLSRVNPDLQNVIESSLHMQHCLCNIVKMINQLENRLNLDADLINAGIIREIDIIAQNGIRAASVGLASLSKEVTADLKAYNVGRRRK